MTCPTAYRSWVLTLNEVTRTLTLQVIALLYSRHKDLQEDLSWVHTPADLVRATACNGDPLAQWWRTNAERYH